MTDEEKLKKDQEEKLAKLDEKVVRMFMSGELANVCCPIDELDNASSPIHIIEKFAGRRTVMLESSCQWVPVARIRRLLFDAIATTGGRAFNLAFRLKDDEDMARMVREARSLGTLKVFEANGHGSIHGDDVLRGSIERADFEKWLAVEWHLSLSGGADAPEDATAAKPAPASEPAAVPEDEWRVLAQNEARRIIKEQAARDLYPNQIDIADDIAADFRKRGIVGSDGKPLSGAYIKRHALKGISSVTKKALSTSINRSK